MAHTEETSRNVLYEIFDITRPILDQRETHCIVVSLAFVKLEYLKNKNALRLLTFEELNSCVNLIEDEFLRMFLSEVFLKNQHVLGVEKLNEIVSVLPDDKEVLINLITDFSIYANFGRMSSEMVTPECVSNLVLNLLDIRPDDKIANLCCGSGSFMFELSSRNANNSVTGFDLNINCIALAKIRSKVLGINAEYHTSYMFNCVDKFDKCFAQIPFGIRYSEIEHYLLDRIEINGFDTGLLSPSSPSEWVFALSIVEHLKAKGKAVFVCTGGALSNGTNRVIREYMINRGWIEAVISLPSQLYLTTGIPINLVVLSEDNDSIRMIDASEICDKGRRMNTINSNQIKEIAGLLVEDREGVSQSFSIQEVFDNECNLMPVRYFVSQIDIKNAVTFDSLMSITRGSTWGRSKLEEFNSAEPTDFCYLELRHIEDGHICGQLPYLTDIDTTQLKYCAEEGDIILSKMGPKFKLAVVGDLKGRKLLVSGNLYILRVDKEKAHPVFIKAFLETEQGMNQLNRGCVGTTIPNIPVSALKEVQIPGLSLDEQNELVRQYEKLRRDNNRYAERIQLNKEKMLHLFDEI